MGFSRQAKLKTLLVIDSAFFFLEIIVGYTVGSLALVADSFHVGKLRFILPRFACCVRAGQGYVSKILGKG